MFMNKNIIFMHKLLINMMIYKIWMTLIHTILNKLYKMKKVKKK